MSNEQLIKDIDALINALKSWKSNLLRQEKLIEKSYGDIRDRAPKQNDKLNCDLGWNKCEIIKNEHFCHALAVNVGIADVRSHTAYETITLYPDSWHKYSYIPTLPREYNYECFDYDGNPLKFHSYVVFVDKDGKETQYKGHINNIIGKNFKTVSIKTEDGFTLSNSSYGVKVTPEWVPANV